MSKVLVISSSIRTGKKSNRVALYFENFLKGRAHDVELVDLEALDFPLFKERLRNLSSPPQSLVDFAAKIVAADGIVLVTPEYNGGYPASLKNAIDVLYEEWHRKPIAISTVSAGPFAGTQVITSLQFSLWKIRAWTVPAMFPIPNIEKSYDENGVPSDKEATDKRAAAFIDELTWCMDAKMKMTSPVK
ncbi:MAG: NADPH-dependent reductase [Ferruginibacter sp.]|nr:NADPH-dependent reductase [Ferruginibacter sp.]